MSFSEKLKSGKFLITCEAAPTQAVYNLETFEKFMKEVEKFRVPILGGIIPLKSAGLAAYS